MTNRETVEELLAGALQIIQAETGYRYSLDPFLLAAFVRVPAGGQVVDLGSGSGVIPLLLCQWTSASRIVGVELQSDLVDRSRRSVALNGLQERVEILHGDVRDPDWGLGKACFDVVTANPPYRPPASGRLSAGTERARARHELTGGLRDFLGAAAGLLKAGGRFYLIHLAQRLPEILAEMRDLRLEPKRLRMVHSRSGQPAGLVLIEGRRNGRAGLEVEAPLVVYRGEGRDYTPEVRAIIEQTKSGTG